MRGRRPPWTTPLSVRRGGAGGENGSRLGERFSLRVPFPVPAARRAVPIGTPPCGGTNGVAAAACDDSAAGAGAAVISTLEQNPRVEPSARGIAAKALAHGADLVDQVFRLQNQATRIQGKSFRQDRVD